MLVTVAAERLCMRRPSTSGNAAIRALVKTGADLGLLDNDGYDCVTIAAMADDEETLRVLLSLGASAKLVTKRYHGTALIAAAHSDHDGIVEQLVVAEAPLDHVNNLHWTAAIESIVLGNGGLRHQQNLRQLIAAGANLRLADRKGNTPLQMARSPGRKTPACIFSCLGRQAFGGAQANSQILFDETSQSRHPPDGKRFGFYERSVLNVQRGFYQSVVCSLTALAQRHSYKFAFSHLHNVAAGRKLQCLVAHHIRIHPHTAAVDQAGGITTG